MKSIIISCSTLAAAAALAFAADEKKPAEDSAASATTAAHASTKSEHHVHRASALKWGEAPPRLPAGAKFTVLDGDPGQPGSFTVRLMMPAGYKIMPHTHTGAERVTVISGTAHVGMGGKFDEESAIKMAPGDFVVLPKGTPHFAFATEDTVLQIHSEGPFEVHYESPADDPRAEKKE